MGLTNDYLVRMSLARDLETAAKTRVSVAKNLGGWVRDGFFGDQHEICCKILAGVRIDLAEQRNCYINLSDTICRIGQDLRLSPDEIDEIRSSILEA
jgi:hypothetical protein